MHMNFDDHIQESIFHRYLILIVNYALRLPSQIAVEAWLCERSFSSCPTVHALLHRFLIVSKHLQLSVDIRIAGGK